MTQTKTEAVSDAAILFPEREVMHGEQRITVREFSFSESLRATEIAGDILNELAQLFTAPDADDRGYEDMAGIFARHESKYLALVALATGLSAEQIAALPGAVGDELSLTFWNVNKGFFTRRLALRVMRRHAPAAAETSDSASSPVH